MKLNSLVDPKKREQIREAIRKKDASLLPASKKPVAQPLVEEKPIQEKSEFDSIVLQPAPQASPPQPQKQTHKKRQWSSISDDDLVKYAKQFASDHGITTRQDLSKNDPGLYTALRKRGLVKTVL